MQPDLEQLRTLKAVVEHGTLDAAASALHVTPSAVSQRLKALETAAGQVLLVRSRPARPTSSGEVVLRLARQVELLAADTAASSPATRRRRGSASPSTPTRWRRGSSPRSRRWPARSPSSAIARTRPTPRGC
jgi:LysR family transcriptional regulator, chromosome initiation inhibitor